MTPDDLDKIIAANQRAREDEKLALRAAACTVLIIGLVYAIVVLIRL